jgi:hypothetical protein
MTATKPSGKPIQFLSGDVLLSAYLESKVNKSDLYGRASVVVEKDGRRLQKGTLLSDGTLVRKEEITMLSLDPGGTPVEPLRMMVDGAEATPEVSSLKRVNPLRKVALIALAGFNVGDVYPLGNGDAAAGEDGKPVNPIFSLGPGLYETTFNFRDSVEPHHAYVLIRQRGGECEAFLLTGVAKQATFLSDIVPYEFFDAAAEAESEEGTDLDFGMV